MNVQLIDRATEAVEGDRGGNSATREAIVFDTRGNTFNWVFYHLVLPRVSNEFRSNIVKC